MVCVPATVGVYMTEQLAELPLPLSVQLVALNVPVELVVKLTVPVGVIAVPGLASVTVAVQVVALPTVTAGGVQATAVVVARLFTVTVVVPLLPLWSVSPP